MEIISFYGTNILAGSILVYLLGTFGTHAIARNQSLDVMLLGQEFQTGILVSALFMNNFFTSEHDDHGTHLETLLSLVFVLCFHFIYLLLLKRKRQYKVEGGIAFIIVFMSLSQILVMLSPNIEFHMVKNLIGDIVTVSKSESYITIIVSFFISAILYFNYGYFKKDSLEFALFGKYTQKRWSQFLFQSLLVILMLFSIHLYGSLFTVGCILLPSFILNIFSVSYSKSYLVHFLNMISVPFAFTILQYNDRIPTTVLIIFIVLFISVIFGALSKIIK